MPLSFFRDSVTVRRARLTIKNGMEVFSWDDATEHVVNKVQVAGASTTRDYAERTLNVDDKRTLRAAYDADIQAGDRIVWEGELYEVDGEVLRTKSPTGRISSTRCYLKRWVG